MSKNTVVVVIILVVILGLGYLGRHQIRSMLGGSPTPSVQTTPSTPSETASPSSASASALVMTKTNAVKGAYLTDSKGMTLYTFDKDTKDKSNCTGGCITLWPPFVAPSASLTGLPANFGVIVGTNGSFQYTLKGMPLYYYTPDKQAGDVKGDGVGGVWHIVKE